MCNERIGKPSELIAEIEWLKREIERLKDYDLTASFLDGVEYGKRMMATQVEKMALNNWLGGEVNGLSTLPRQKRFYAGLRRYWIIVQLG